MNKSRLSYERYLKWLDCHSEEEPKSKVINFSSRSSRHGVEQGIPKTIKKLKIYTTKDVKDLLVNNWNLLVKVAKTLETITISTGVSIYVVKEESMKLHRWIKGSISRHCYDIKPGTILAAYSAYMRKLQISNTSSHNPNYPLGIGKSSDLHVLSLPVVTPSNKVLAVIDLYRDLKGEKYSQEDQLIGLTTTDWLAAAYEKHYNSNILHKENGLHQSMFNILTDFFKVNRNIDKLIESISMFIKSAMNVSSITFYRNIVAKQHCAYVYEEDELNKMVKSEKPKRLNRSNELLSIVLRSHKIVNVNINNLDEKYHRCLNTLRSKTITTILLFPIIRSGSLLGVIQLTDKWNGKDFTNQDEEFLENFSKYYSIALHYTNVSEMQRRIEMQLLDEKMMLMSMLQPCKHDFDELMNKWRHIKNKDLPDNFLTFSYYPWHAGEFKLMKLSLILLNYSVRDAFENEESMVRFVIMANKVYRKIQYHNFEHAFNVTHCMLNIKRLTENSLNEYEWKALIVACFCHDMDHPGFTNNFLKATSHYLVELYQESVLENHHSYVAHQLIKELKLFSKFSAENYKFIMNEIHEAIIATDLAVYFKRSGTLTSIITSDTFCWRKSEHKRLLKGVMMTTCDLSGQLKPCDIAVDLTMQIYEEFYLQGDKEKALGLKPISMMDRELKVHIPNDQLDFITLICVPCVDILVTFLPQLNPILMNVIALINYWLEEKKKHGFISEEDEKKEETRLKRIHERINKSFKTKY